MSIPTLTDAIDSRWLEMARTLGLDAPRPLWPDMGLGELDDERLAAGARAGLADPQSPFTAHDALVAAAVDRDGEARNAWLERWARVRWIVVFSDHPVWWSLRRCIVYACVREGRHKWLRLGPHRTEPVVSAVLEAEDLDDVDARIARIKAEPLSDRDVQICVDAGLDPDVERLDFFAYPRSVIRIRRFQELVATMTTELDQQSLDHLRDGAQETANHLKHGVTFPPLVELVRDLP